MKRAALCLLFLSLFLLRGFAAVSADDPDGHYDLTLTHESGEARVPRPKSEDSPDHEGALPAVTDEDAENGEIPPYSIFQKDDREIFYETTTAYPYRTVVFILTDEGSCSGAMIGPHYAVTAGHCLFDRENGWVKEITVCPAMANWEAPYGCADWTQIWVPDEYGYQWDQDWDVGLIELDRDLGSQTGWLGSRSIKDDECHDQVMILGNLGDYRSRAVGNLQGTTWNGKRLKYKIDTVPGTSGGPVIISDHGDWSYIAGIHVTGSETTYSTDYNSAVRYRDEINDFLSPYWGK